MTFPSGGRKGGRWRPATNVERDAIVTADGLELGDLCVVLADGGEYICTDPAVSTWVAEATGGGGGDLATVLGGGNTTGGTDIDVSNFDSIKPLNDGMASSGGASNRWSAVHANVGNFSLDGDALVLNKTNAAEQRGPIWQDGGTLRYQWIHQTDERLRLASYDSGGINEADVFSVTPNVAGAIDVDIVGALQVFTTGDAVLDGGLAVAGAALTDGVPAGNNLVIGDGVSANDYGLTVFVNNDSDGGLYVTDTIGTEDGSLVYDPAGTAWFFRTSGGTNRMRVTGAGAMPGIDGADDLGIGSLRWGLGFINQVLVGGAIAANGVANHANVVIGDGTAPAGLTFFGDAAGVGTTGLAWTDASGVAQGGIDYDLTNNRFFIRTTTGVNRVTIDGNSMDPGSDGSMSLGAPTVGWDVFYLEENASITVPQPDHGAHWVLNDTPNTAVFTDDAGGDRYISRMETVHFRPEDATLATNPPFAASNFDQSNLNFNGVATTEQAFWSFELPWNYAGQDLVFRIQWYKPNANAGDVVWQAQFVLFADGQDLAAFAYDTAQTVTAAPGAVANTLDEVDITIPSSALDGAVKGDRVHVRLFRDPGDGADTYNSDAHFVHGALMEI